MLERWGTEHAGSACHEVVAAIWFFFEEPHQAPPGGSYWLILSECGGEWRYPGQSAVTGEMHRQRSPAIRIGTG